MSMPLDVHCFLAACDQTPSADSIALYAKLIEEEYGEFVEARSAQDECETLDACMDMIWVILGFCRMKGYDVHGAWNEVVRTNMAKVDSKTGKVSRREDGKILKPDGWTPPAMSAFI